MKTRVCLKYFVNDCLWKQLLSCNLPQTPSNVISFTIFVTLMSFTQFHGEFMKKVTVWDYASITRDSYLALSHDEKEKLIRRYYFDTKSRGGSGKFYFI